MKIACDASLLYGIASRSLNDPFFPATFLMRNIAALEREPAWIKRPPRLKRAHVHRLVRERCRFFQETSDWKRKKKSEVPIDCENLPGQCADHRDSYCTHCGECCEIASGLPDFPEGVLIPSRWRDLFGKGLGRHHRFCPFLWESRKSGFSLCSIHPFRPNPCRAFEREECQFLQQGK